ncbi:AAA family ATPase [Natronorubrum sp. JWXQ-INN-674]|uniref:AAA family ATPase n=1 Tax=Natronorubrum halalkaliphilum TaxID=2691917 RepID=A0A6B0VL55_9EURY|nr:AAA family ATPase [Natronorubrum halalkaliphilum]MXV62571.1 AAA family ATPase [Natronorubrum halalkaliphilum]
MARPTLLVYCGLPGVGKSVASAYAAERLSATRYRSDAVRKELFPNPSYTSAESAATYAELLERARTDLESGTDVVLDATFRTRTNRDQAVTVAREAGADAMFVHVTCALEVVEERIERRTNTISDAQFEQHLQLRESFEPIERDHVVIDNSGSLEETYAQLERTVL